MKLIQFIKYKVGDGRSVFAWLDNWHPMGPLKQKFGHNVICDAASFENAKMTEFVGGNCWNMHAFECI